MKTLRKLGLEYNKEVLQIINNGMDMSFTDTDVYMKFGKTPLVQPGQWYEFGGVRQVDVGKACETSCRNMAREI